MSYLSYELRTAKIIRFRRDNMLTQAEFAKQAGLNSHTVKRLEGGQRASRATVRALADTMGCEVLDLVA